MMKKSIGRNEFYKFYIDNLNEDIEIKEKKRDNIYHARYDLISLIQNDKFSNAVIIFENKEPVNFIEYFINIKTSVWNFKVTSCKVLNEDGEDHEYSLFLRGTIYNVIKYNRVLKDLEDQLEELESYKVDKETYLTVLDVHDQLFLRFLLDGKVYNFGAGLGRVFIREKERDYRKKIVNYELSNKEKKRLLAEGKIPFKKEDAIKAAEEGREYKGVEWLIYRYEKFSYWLFWSKERFVKNVVLYSFVPNNMNHTGESVYDLEKKVSFSSIPNLKLGLLKMIHMCRRMDEEHILKWRKNSNIKPN